MYITNTLKRTQRESNPDRISVTQMFQPTLEPWRGVHQQNKTPIYTHTTNTFKATST